MKYYVETLKELSDKGIKLPERWMDMLTGTDTYYYRSMYVLVIEHCGKVTLLNELFVNEQLAYAFGNQLMPEDMGWEVVRE